MRSFVAFLNKEKRAISLYRVDYLLKLCYGFIAMYGIKSLWVALYSQDPAIVGRALPSMITYAMLAVALDMIFYPSAMDSAPNIYIAQRIRTGLIDADLLKPMDFQLQILMQNSGATLFAALGVVLPTWILAAIFLGMQLPPTIIGGATFLLSCVCSYLLLFSLNFLLGMVSFVTTDIRNITLTYSGLVGVLSGKLIPIWIFPAWLQNICAALPFKHIFETPLNIYTGEYVGSAIIQGIMMQLAWASALMVIGHFVWRKVYRYLSVQGG